MTVSTCGGEGIFYFGALEWSAPFFISLQFPLPISSTILSASVIIYLLSFYVYTNLRIKTVFLLAVLINSAG